MIQEANELLKQPETTNAALQTAGGTLRSLVLAFFQSEMSCSISKEWETHAK